MSNDSLDGPEGSEPLRSFFNGTMDVRVYEADHEVQGERALVFETDFGKRYALVYPTDWRHMTDSELTVFARRIPD